MQKGLFIFIGIFISQFIFAQDIIIKDATILPMHMDGTIEGKSVRINGGKIVQIAPFSRIKKPKKTRIVDAKGLFLMPGLADMHVHLPINTQLDSVLMLSLSAGVTHVRAMNAEEDPMNYLSIHQVKVNSEFPKIFTSYINTGKDRFSVNQLDSLMLSIKKQGYRFIKLFSVANEETFLNVMKMAHKHEIIVAGHFPGDLSMDLVLKSKFKSIEHLGGYIPQDKVGNLDRVVSLSKEIYNCPTLNYFISELPKDTSYHSHLVKVLKALDKESCRILVGSDLDGQNGMFAEMKIWENIGISRYKILKSATFNPSLFFNESQEWGSIQVGREASFLLLNKNLLLGIDHLKSIKKIFLRGKDVKQKF